MAVWRDIVSSENEKKVSRIGTGFRTGNTTLKQETAMKKTTIHALHTMLAVTSDNLGFVIVWVIAMGVILKLACA